MATPAEVLRILIAADTRGVAEQLRAVDLPGGAPKTATRRTAEGHHWIGRPPLAGYTAEVGSFRINA